MRESVGVGVITEVILTIALVLQELKYHCDTIAIVVRLAILLQKCSMQFQNIIMLFYRASVHLNFDYG